MTGRGVTLDLLNARQEPLYAKSSSFKVPGTDKLRVFFRLMARPTPPIVHFFFSPNPATCMAARLFKRTHPNVRVVQTIMSLTEHQADLRNGLFGDVVITWSARGARLVQDALRGRAGSVHVVHIPPGVEPLSPMSAEERQRARAAFNLPRDGFVVLFAGDLEFSQAAMQVARAALEVTRHTEAVFVFACRPKTPSARLVERDLRQVMADMQGKVRIMGKVDGFHDLLRCVDVQVLPAETTFAKTDIPLVIIEGLFAGVPAIVTEGTPMEELVEAGAAVGIPPLSEAALVDAIRGVMARGGAPSLGAAGRAYALMHHTAQAMAARHAEIYQALLRHEGFL